MKGVVYYREVLAGAGLRIINSTTKEHGVVTGSYRRAKTTPTAGRLQVLGEVLTDTDR